MLAVACDNIIKSCERVIMSCDYTHLLQLPFLCSEYFQNATLNHLGKFTPKPPQAELSGKIQLVFFVLFLFLLLVFLLLVKEFCRVDVLVEGLHVRGDQVRACRLLGGSDGEGEERGGGVGQERIEEMRENKEMQ